LNLEIVRAKDKKLLPIAELNRGLSLNRQESLTVIIPGQQAAISSKGILFPAI
jgi:hypothetical protein